MTVPDETTEGPPMVILIGAPGAGKSTVGRLLAESLGVGFRDTDADIEAATGRRVDDIFLTDGEAAFRNLEAVAVAAAIAGHGGVLALGGGAALDPETAVTLSKLPTVWLQVGAAAAAARVGMNTPRPVLLGNVRQQLAALLAERSPGYERAARWSVTTDGRQPDGIVEEIVTLLERTPEHA